MTTILNLYAGPGAGKSTSAAFLFARLKKLGVNAELVREYVKDWAWEKRTIGTYDQWYFLGKQIRKESMLFGKVDAIVTDSPIMLGVYYARHFFSRRVAEAIRANTIAYYEQCAADGHEHIHVLLKRTKEYNPAGRYQTEEEAKEIDVEVERLLRDLKVTFVQSGTSDEELTKLLEAYRVGR